jgi:hypothetical protein
LIACAIRISSKDLNHLVCGYKCDEKYYIYDSNSITVECNWNNRDFENYTQIYNKLYKGGDAKKVYPIFLLYTKQTTAKVLLEENQVTYIENGGRNKKVTKDKVVIKQNKKVYVVNTNKNKERYITVNKEKILLSTLRGKYKYMKSV